MHANSAFRPAVGQIWETIVDITFLARSPEGEINYPAGTKFVIQYIEQSGYPSWYLSRISIWGETYSVSRAWILDFARFLE